MTENEKETYAVRLASLPFSSSFFSCKPKAFILGYVCVRTYVRTHICITHLFIEGKKKKKERKESSPSFRLSCCSCCCCDSERMTTTKLASRPKRKERENVCVCVGFQAPVCGKMLLAYLFEIGGQRNAAEFAQQPGKKSACMQSQPVSQFTHLVAGPYPLTYCSVRKFRYCGLLLIEEEKKCS